MYMPRQRNLPRPRKIAQRLRSLQDAHHTPILNDEHSTWTSVPLLASPRLVHNLYVKYVECAVEIGRQESIYNIDAIQKVTTTVTTILSEKRCSRVYTSFSHRITLNTDTCSVPSAVTRHTNMRPASVLSSGMLTARTPEGQDCVLRNTSRPWAV